jgi:hypothetical protein
MKPAALSSLAALALTLYLAAPASASAAECKLVLTGAVTQEFPCKAELWKRSDTLWNLIVIVPSDKPFDASASFNFTSSPEAATAYSMASKPVDYVDVSIRDKHAKGFAAWAAGVKKTKNQFDRKDRPLPPPQGAVEAKLTAIGAKAPEVHGTVQATLKADMMNTAKGDVKATFTF